MTVIGLPALTVAGAPVSLKWWAGAGSTGKAADTAEENVTAEPAVVEATTV